MIPADSGEFAYSWWTSTSGEWRNEATITRFPFFTPSSISRLNKGIGDLVISCSIMNRGADLEFFFGRNTSSSNILLEIVRNDYCCLQPLEALMWGRRFIRLERVRAPSYYVGPSHHACSFYTDARTRLPTHENGVKFFLLSSLILFWCIVVFIWGKFCVRCARIMPDMARLHSAQCLNQFFWYEWCDNLVMRHSDDLMTTLPLFFSARLHVAMAMFTLHSLSIIYIIAARRICLRIRNFTS